LSNAGMINGEKLGGVLIFPQNANF